jgi:hypothetical protein
MSPNNFSDIWEEILGAEIKQIVGQHLNKDGDAKTIRVSEVPRPAEISKRHLRCHQRDEFDKMPKNPDHTCGPGV